MPDARSHPQPRVRNKKAHEIVTTGPPKRSGTPCANGFNGFLRALLGEPGFLATIASGKTSANFTSASGCEDHTTSPSASCAFVSPRQSVHRIPRPTFVTIAKRPSGEAGPCKA